jgi:hypothetical protein
MSAYLEKQKLLDWLDEWQSKLYSSDAYILDEVIEQIEKGVFDWQPND